MKTEPQDIGNPRPDKSWSSVQLPQMNDIRYMESDPNVSLQTSRGRDTVTEGRTITYVLKSGTKSYETQGR